MWSDSEDEADPWPFSSFGDPDDKLVPRGAARQQISDLLDRVVRHGGEFSFGAAAPTFGVVAPTLPALPGLTVKDVGHVSVPLLKEDVEELVGRFTKQGGGGWELPADQVELTNPEWRNELKKLCTTIAGRLGYKQIALQAELSKLLVYGKGSRLDKQQDTNNDNGRVVAKLVVQLPSEYEGGDLVVFEGGSDKQFRYDFGKKDNTAAFEPHYAVYVAGAQRAVEEVTSGYRLVVVYSLVLPSEMASLGAKSGSDLLQMQLSEALKKLEDESGGTTEEEDEAEEGDSIGDNGNKSIVLLLSKHCTRQNIESSGSGALSDFDRDRFQALSGANALLPPEKQLRFYIACLKFWVIDNGRWGEKEAKETATWYSMSGEKLGDGNKLEWTEELHFLNPGKETRKQLWMNPDMETYPGYERYALVGWPQAVDLANSHTLMGEVSAIASILAENPVDSNKLQTFFKTEMGEEEDTKPATTSAYALYPRTAPKKDEIPVSLAFCQKLCKAMAEAGDATLIEVFFKKFFGGLKEKREFVPLLATLVRKFSWPDVATPILNTIDRQSYDTRMGLALKLADALEDADARTAVTMFAVEKAQLFFPRCQNDLSSSADVGLLWKLAMDCPDPKAFTEVEKLFQRMDASLLGPVVQACSKYIDATRSADQRAALVSIASTRRQWLATEIADIEKPFTWEIPDSGFLGSAAVEAFLCGPDSRFFIRDFTGIVPARAHSALLRGKIKARLNITESGRGREAFVKIEKAGGKFDERRKNVKEYKVELERLAQMFPRDAEVGDGGANATGKKRLREEGDAVVIE
ncbi:hypothetical protein BBJ28_00015439 [Nothophytophthora sp. Chile5]|nr:hypothetical protein BBJ28_00015439 [Nothophytophthora sp. Chile5]